MSWKVKYIKMESIPYSYPMYNAKALCLRYKANVQQFSTLVTCCCCCCCCCNKNK